MRSKIIQEIGLNAKEQGLEDWLIEIYAEINFHNLNLIKGSEGDKEK